jgi:hypothetical protein
MKMTFEQFNKMKEAGLSEDQIQTIAQKKGIKVPSEGLLGGVARQVVVEPAMRVGQALGYGIAKLAGATPEQLDRASKKDFSTTLPILGEMNVKAQKGFGEGGGMQVAGTALEQASTYTPYGRVASAMAKGIAKGAPALANTGGFVGAGVLGGYGFDVAQGLKEGEPDLTPGLGTAIGGAIPLVPSVAKGVGSALKFGTAQSTGLTPETISTLLTNPKALTDAQKEGLSRVSLSQEVKRAFNERIKQLSYTGKAYGNIRGTVKNITLDEDIPTKVLNKYGVKIEDGKVVVGPESTPLKSGDRSALEDFIAQYGNVKTLTPNGILNVRQALDNLAVFEQGKSGVSKAIATVLRKEYDAVAKKALPQLEKLDTKYAPEKKLIRALQKDFFDVEGELKDNAITKIANIANEGKEKQLKRLEELLPGIGQRAQLVKAISDIGATGGQKVGTYTRAAVTGGAFLTNPVLGVVSAVLTMPTLAVPIIKTVGRMRGWADDAVTRLVAKITTGKTLTASELVMFRVSMEEHIKKVSPGDQFLETPLGKKTEKYVEGIQHGMSLKGVSGGKASVVTDAPILGTFERASGLSVDDAKIEQRAFDKILSNEDSLLREYFANKKLSGPSGNIINTDNFRPLFKSEGYVGSNAAAVQEPASYLSKKAFTQALKNEGEYVAFTAGGSGTGKSSALKGIPSISKELDGAAAVLDSNLSSYNSAIKKLKEAQNAGKAAVIDYVYRDPLDSFENGVVKRMLTNTDEGGRLVPSKVVAGNHIDSFDVVKRLLGEGHAVRFVDNSLGAGKARLSTYSDIKNKAKYPSVEELTNRMNAVAQRLYKDGIITKQQYEGYIK